MKMPVYVAEDVLCYDTCGIVAIEAESIEEAKNKVKSSEFLEFYRAGQQEEVIEKLREIKKGEVITIIGTLYHW